MENVNKGFALRCNDNGVIEEVLRDDFGVTDSETKLKLFANLVHSSSKNKALDFIVKIKSENVVLDYCLYIPSGDNIYEFCLVGVRLKEGLLVVGAAGKHEAVEYTNQLQEINNEQANLIRKLLKDADSKEIVGDNETNSLFNELSAVNNELVNLQRELSAKNTELERLNELKNKFIGMAAHDLRNPLSVIINYTEFLLEEASDELDEQYVKFLETMFDTSNYMLNLVEDLLDFAHIESGKIKLDTIEYDLIKQAGKTVEALNTIASRKSIRIELESSNDEIIIKADKSKIEQVFQNLIGNAIKFSFPDSTIRVVIIDNHDFVEIKVEDSGKGISKEDQEGLFKPFSRSKSMGTGGEKGTGLGLYIVNRIIEAHSGDIKVESSPGKGTTFIINLNKGI